MNGTPFVFRENPEFDWPVVVRIPAETGFVEQQFTATFRLMPDADFVAPYEGEGAAEVLAEEIRRMEQILVGWRGIATEAGDELEITDANRRALLGNRLVRMALNRAYTEAVILNGQRAKNFAPPRS